MDGPTPLPLEIPLDKGHIDWVLGACVLFVVAAPLAYLHPEEVPRLAPEVARVMAVICGVAFAACGIYLASKRFDTRPGLVVDAEGLVDNSSALAAGRIPWRDIKAVEVTEVNDQPFLTIEVHDPEAYIRRASPLKRPLAAMTHRMFGSPIHITPHTLAIDFDELVDLVVDAHERHAGPGSGA